jgi:hypothetical protein
MIALRKANLATSTVDDDLSKVECLIAKFRADQEELHQTILTLEASSSGGGTTARMTEDAQALINGKDYDPTANVVSQLDAGRKKAHVMRRALELLYRQRDELMMKRGDEIFASFSSEVAKVERRRIMAALELQRANRERETLRETIRVSGGGGFLPADGFELLGIGDLQDELWECCERAITRGIVSRDEIEKAKRDR